MEKVDILIAVVAVIAVAGSVAGAALYEPPEGGVTWGVAFSESAAETLPSDSDQQSVTASTSGADPGFVLEHNVSAVGVTLLEFEVTISTSRALPRTGTVTYEAYLVAPDGTELRGDTEETGNVGLGTSFTLTVPDTYLMEVPEDTTVRAESEQAARQQINETVLQSNATGVWEVHVHMAFGQGTAPVPENVEVESTPNLRRVDVEVGTDLDIFAGA